MSGRRLVHVGPIFGAKEYKCPTTYANYNKTLETAFQKLSTFSKSVQALSRNRNPNMSQNQHIYAINCGRPEVTVDAISSQTANTVPTYIVVNFEVAS